MLTTIILNNDEPNVIQYTYEALYKEMKDIQGAELIVSFDWFETLKDVRNNYVCLVEADCLVSPGFFDKQIEGLLKAPLRKISMLTPIVAVKRWDNCVYGYDIGGAYTDQITPIKSKKSSRLYPVQIGYLPGAIVRTKMLKQVVSDGIIGANWKDNLVFLSTQISLAFWRQGQGGAQGQNGNPVYINPSVTYVTTENYVNDIGHFELDTIDLMSKFNKEAI